MPVKTPLLETLMATFLLHRMTPWTVAPILMMPKFTGVSLAHKDQQDHRAVRALMVQMEHLERQVPLARLDQKEILAPKAYQAPMVRMEHLAPLVHRGHLVHKASKEIPVIQGQ